MKVETQIYLPFLQKEVYEYVADPIHFPKWMSNHYSRELVSGVQGEEGAIARHCIKAEGRIMEFEEQVVLVQKPEFFRVQLESKEIGIIADYRFVMQDGATLLQLTEAYNPHNIFFKTIKFMLQKMAKKRQLVDLHLLLEAMNAR